MEHKGSVIVVTAFWPYIVCTSTRIIPKVLHARFAHKGNIMPFLVAIARHFPGDFKVRAIVGVADIFCSRKQENFFVSLKLF